MGRVQISKIPLIDLFAGAGGLAIGSEMAGADVRLSVELDATCCSTLRENFRKPSHKVLQSDVSSLSGKDLRKYANLSASDPLIIVGGPPCQPFSKAAYWTDPGDESRFRRARARGEEVESPRAQLGPRLDQRRDLVGEFVRLVEESKATGFLFENVLSILHPRNKGLVDQLLSSFRRMGHKVTVVKVNAAEYGIPQLRQRLFILGHRAKQPMAPKPTHSLDREKKNGLKLPVYAGAALKGLDKPCYSEPEEVVTGRWAKHLQEIPPGWNYKWHTAWAGHKEPSFEAETRFWSFLLKLSPDKPSWTIAASPGPWVGPFHWESRRLRTVELAALQTFPRKYKFSGPRRERVRQIGNAVPPQLAAVMIRQLLEVEQTG